MNKIAPFPASAPAAEPLFISDADLIARLDVGEKRARAAIRELERQGFPQPDPLFGKRYFPAVKRFLDQRHGLSVNSPAPLKPDGAENWGSDNEED